MKMIFMVALVLALTPKVFAQSGADVLMDELSGGKSTIKIEPKSKDKEANAVPEKKVRINVNLNDPVVRHLFAQMETQNNLPYDVRAWTDHIFSEEYVKAAHLWTTLQSQIPAGFQSTATAAHLYSLWKIGLGQTFFDQWLRNLSDPQYGTSNGEAALESAVNGGLENWLLQNSIIITPEHEAILAKLDSKKPMIVTLKAWNSLRNGDKAEDLLAALPADSKLRFYLAQTATLEHIKKNDLKGAARILKVYMEPAIEKNKDVQALAQHDINIARLLYQAGQMSAAAEFYKKIPNTSPLFFEAREELSWTYLRRGETAKLRGELTSLAFSPSDSRFLPEMHLVKSILDLKMCFYDAVEKDLKSFNEQNVVWAKKIDQAVTQQDPPAPTNPDAFTQMAVRGTAALEKEKARVVDLGEQSIGATLPAVGKQKHWKDYQATLESALEMARKRQADEYRRQWKNQKTILAEAIRKMRFVKLEYLSQVRELGKSAAIPGSQGLVADNNAVPAAALTKGEEDKITFPVTGELWPDELFKLRSTAQARCLKKK